MQDTPNIPPEAQESQGNPAPARLVCPQPGHGAKYMHGDSLLCMECGGIVPPIPAPAQAGPTPAPVDALLNWLIEPMSGRVTEAAKERIRDFLSAQPTPGAREALATLVNDLDLLIKESNGVAGLHLNGEVAPWHDLTAGGRYEPWLKSLEDARAVLASIPSAQPTPESREVRGEPAPAQAAKNTSPFPGLHAEREHAAMRGDMALVERITEKLDLLDSLPIDELVRAGLRRFGALSAEMRIASATFHALEGLEAWVCGFNPEKAHASFTAAAHVINEEMRHGN